MRKEKKPMGMGSKESRWIIGLFAFLVAHGAQANPLAIDRAARPIRMVAEDVQVEVGEGLSRVKGSYVFQQGEDDWPAVRDTHVVIYVPVLLPADDRTYEENHGTPVVTAGGRRISTFIRNDLSTGNEPREVPLPKGWRMQIFECEVPLAGLGGNIGSPEGDRGNFEVEVEYVQPHFAGNTSAYVPLAPPDKGGTIRFVAAPGRTLKPVGVLSGLAPARAEITVRPRDRKLIRVRVVDRR